MRSKRDVVRLHKLYIALALLLTLVAYQNCSLVNTSHSDGLASYALMSGCLAPAEKLFYETYYPRVRSQCTTCHDNKGIGIGWFASSDPAYAFNAFMTSSRSKIDSMMIYDGHPGPNNGPAQQTFVTAQQGKWEAVEALTASCTSGNSLQTVAKNTPVASIVIPNGNGDPNRRPWRVLEWDLFTELLDPNMGGQLHLVIRLQYREAQAGGADIGYEFSRPQARIRAGAPAGVQYALDNFTVFRNGQLLSTVTSFQAINNFVVGVPTDTLLLDAGASPGIVPSKNLATDVFALRIGKIRRADGEPLSVAIVDGPVIPTTPLPTTISYTELMTTTNTYGYMARSCVSCHSATVASGGLNLQDYNQAKAAAAAIKARVNDAMNPMPKAGLLPQYDRDVISKWVDLGAPQN